MNQKFSLKQSVYSVPLALTGNKNISYTVIPESLTKDIRGRAPVEAVGSYALNMKAVENALAL